MTPMKEILYIIKVGGNIIDDERKLSAFLADFAALPGRKILVHGGGKLATRMADQLNIPQQMVDGRRITDEETLRIVTMVYAGYINKSIIAYLQANDCPSIGISGADGDAIRSHRRIKGEIDYGFVGDVDAVNADLISNWLEQGLALVVAPITHDGKGQLLNTNADTIAQELASSLSERYLTILTYSFEKNGVLIDIEDELSVIPLITPSSYAQLKEEGRIFAGMIPKLDNAFRALASGVERVIIGKGEDLYQLLAGKKGTTINLNK
jgi:acetylglutamate kinase